MDLHFPQMPQTLWMLFRTMYVMCYGTSAVVLDTAEYVMPNAFLLSLTDALFWMTPQCVRQVS